VLEVLPHPEEMLEMQEAVGKVVLEPLDLPLRPQQLLCQEFLEGMEVELALEMCFVDPLL
jgi:hypothetical protein